MTAFPISSTTARSARLIIVALALILVAAIAARPAHAAGIVVNDAGDTTGACATTGAGACTLRDAITYANSNPGADTITFNIPSGGACSSANTCTITLVSSLPSVTGDVTINGAPNSGHITVSGNNANILILDVESGGTLTVNALTLADSAYLFGGGAVTVKNGGTLNLTNSTLRNNHSGFGAGGAISVIAGGTANVTNSTFSNNSTPGNTNGGAIWNNGTLNVASSTFSNNQAGSSGLGAGIFNFSSGVLTLSNTIIANSISGGDCVNSGGTVTGSYNLIEDSANACGLSNGVNNNIVGSDPNLGYLANNGGPTQTYALLTGSPAIDAGNTTLSADQRGYGRPAGAADDIGAYEYNATPLAVTLASFDVVQQGDAVLVTWETVSELDNRGFNLYRGTSPAGPDRQLNAALIPSQSPGNPGGFIYSWEDRADLLPGETYWYWLEDVSLSGVTTLHGAVSVVYATPTAVTLSGLEAAGQQPVPPAWLWLPALIAVGAALAIAGRRSVRA